MKSIFLNLSLILLVLVTSCNSKEKKEVKNNTTVTEEVTPKADAKKESITFTDTKWKLVMLKGNSITNDNAFITFSTEENRVSGNGSCNNFTGTYTLKEGNRISLSEIAATMKICPDMTTEDQFMEVLKEADNYSLNGNKMTLNKARMAPLAVFEVAK